VPSGNPSGRPSGVPSDLPSALPSVVPSPSVLCGGKNLLRIFLLTDQYGGETSWSLTDDSDTPLGSTDEVYANSVNYQFPAQNSAYCLEADKCYNLNIFDSYGDGLCCAYGNGYFFATLDGDLVEFIDGQGITFNQFDTFGNSASGEFCI